MKKKKVKDICFHYLGNQNILSIPLNKSIFTILFN